MTRPVRILLAPVAAVAMAFTVLIAVGTWGRGARLSDWSVRLFDAVFCP